jgi:hypothetical protein
LRQNFFVQHHWPFQKSSNVKVKRAGVTGGDCGCRLVDAASCMQGIQRLPSAAPSAVMSKNTLVGMV